MSHVELSDRALCNVDDVASYAPGYKDRPDDDTDETLIRLINAESRTAHRTTGREFVAVASGSVTRQFDVTTRHVGQRRVKIGDASTVTAVVLKDQADVTLATVTAGDWLALPRIREEWEPIRRIWFPPASASPASLAEGSVLHVTGTWGFPAVPDDVREAVAKLVVVRYVNDAAAAGTALAEALTDGGIDVAALLGSAFDALRSYADLAAG